MNIVNANYFCNFNVRLCPYLYDLAHMNAEMAKTCIQEVIKEKHDEFERSKRKYPEMDTVCIILHTGSLINI